MQSYLLIGFFGLVGVFTRFGIDRLFPSAPSSFPLSTFTINILGSFFAGCLYVLGLKHTFSSTVQWGLLIGFCGGFTTFSTFSLQVVHLIENGKLLLAGLYLVATPVLGFLTAFLPVLIYKKKILGL